MCSVRMGVNPQLERDTGVPSQRLSNYRPSSQHGRCKLLVIAKIWAAIIISVANHCSRWYGHREFSTFLSLTIKIDLALKLCLLSIVNLGGFFGRFIGTCGGLFTKVHIALLFKTKFGLCLDALGFGGYN
ncbi:hypothetical protein BDV93DRAFT_505947 [Ceratobasidium sp. AG-I]|nr:hypothetical protein BDV93DRAFT_505947 [Ceratobasidium sp. AG-I]